MTKDKNRPYSAKELTQLKKDIANLPQEEQSKRLNAFTAVHYNQRRRQSVAKKLYVELPPDKAEVFESLQGILGQDTKVTNKEFIHATIVFLGSLADAPTEAKTIEDFKNELLVTIKK